MNHCLIKNVHVGNDQEKVQSEKIPTPKTEAGKTLSHKTCIWNLKPIPWLSVIGFHLTEDEHIEQYVLK